MTVTQIGPLIVCRRCNGSLEVDGEPCDRCAVDGVPTGVDPVARQGCLCGEEHEHGATIDIGGGFRFPSSLQREEEQ